jgi:hypothetical protein
MMIVTLSISYFPVMGKKLDFCARLLYIYIISRRGVVFPAESTNPVDKSAWFRLRCKPDNKTFYLKLL